MGEEGKDVVLVGGLPLRPGDRIGGYVYERVIATGGMAHVLLARNPGGERVALKVLKSSRLGSGLGRFRREFRALSRLNHEHVVRVEAYGDIHGHPYIAMEYVEGTDLHAVLRGFRNLPYPVRWRRAEEILADLASALAHIHRHGLVHRDLKPSNVLVDRRGRCKLTDFGIVKDLDPSASDPFISTTLVGTWAYASPEQIGGDPVDHRSDLYSLGVVLYAMLTGRRPFAAKDMAGYLEAHRRRRPVPPREIEPEVPEHLERICLKLLAKAPRDRFQSAREVLALLEHAPAPAPAGAAPAAPWEPPLVEREAQLDALRDAVSALTRGEGGVVLVEGPEGCGRTRLLRAALDFAGIIGIPVHVARLSPGEAAFDALVQIARDIGRELGPRVPAELAAALDAFVEGRRGLGGDLRYRLYDGMREGVRALLRDGPQVLAVDDLHHAPEPLGELLLYLVRGLRHRRDRGALLLLLTARTDVPSRAVDAFRDERVVGFPVQRVRVGPLGPEGVAEVAAAALGPGERARALAERLHRDTGGNPFFVAEFLRSAVLRGEERTSTADDDDATEILDGEVPPGIAEVVRERVGRHGAVGRELVELLAAHGREIDLDVLVDAARAPEDAAIDALDRMIECGLLVERRVGFQSLVDLAQRKVGEVLYRELPRARAADLHLRLAAAFERRHADGPLAAEAIGEHYRRAGEAGRAWKHLARAARGLAERALLAEAWTIAERALALEGRAREELASEEFARARVDLLRVRARALFNRGRWEEAEGVLRLLRSAALAMGEREVADRAGLDRGTCLWRLGREAQGRALVEKVLGRARTRHDRPVAVDALHRLAAFAWEEGDLDACERLAGEGLVLATDHSGARAEILLALTAVQASRGDVAQATRGLEEAEAILRELRSKRTHAVVLCNLAELHCWLGQLGRAWERATAALSLARDVLFREGEAFARQVRALTLLEVGDHARGADEARRAIAICEETRIAGDLVAVLYIQGRLALAAGEVERAVDAFRAGLSAARRQDPERYAPALEASLARALTLSGDRAGAAHLLDRVVARLDELPTPRATQVRLLCGAALLGLGRREQGLDLVREAAAAARSRGFANLEMRARAIVGRVAVGREAERAAAEARALADRLAAALPDELARPFRAQPLVRALLGGG